MKRQSIRACRSESWEHHVNTRRSAANRPQQTASSENILPQKDEVRRAECDYSPRRQQRDAECHRHPFVRRSLAAVVVSERKSADEEILARGPIGTDASQDRPAD